MGYVGVVSISWLFFIHYILNHVSTKHNYQLIQRWMKISGELPAKSKQDYEVVGLSREENQQFWLKEQAFMARYYRIMRLSFSASYVIFNVQLFFTR